MGIAYFGGCLNILLIYCFITLNVHIIICNGLCALFCCWSLVFIKRIIYKFSNVCSFDYTAFAVSGKVWYPKPVKAYQVWWLSVPQLIVRILQTLCYRSIGGVFVMQRCFFGDFSLGVGSFVIGLRQIFSFFAVHNFGHILSNRTIIWNKVIAVCLPCLISFELANWSCEECNASKNYKFSKKLTDSVTGNTNLPLTKLWQLRQIV